MPVVVINACRSSYGRLTYIFNQPVHNNRKTNHRVLACSGINIKMIHTQDGRLTCSQSGVYLEQQFRQNLKKARNPSRKYQAQSVIVSFAPSEFDTGDLNKQSTQALKLLQGFVQKYYGDTQAVIAVQCDGKGEKLHGHILINTIKNNGKAVQTSRFSIYKIRKNMNEYMASNYSKVTGKRWTDPLRKQIARQEIPSKSVWQEHLKKVINQVKRQVSNVEEFVNALANRGITVTERGKQKRWTYHEKVQSAHGIKELKVRAFYQRKDKKTGEVLTTRGLGAEYTKSGLEYYWQQRQTKNQPLQLKKHDHKEKEANNHEAEEREQIIKIRTKAAQARAAANQKIRQRQLTLQRLRDAEVKEQQHDRKIRSTYQRNSQQERSKGVSQQRRHQEDAKRIIKQRQCHAKANQSKNSGPEL